MIEKMVRPIKGPDHFFMIASRMLQKFFRLRLNRMQHIAPESPDHYRLDGMVEEYRLNIVQQSLRIAGPF
ncbi:hypothetical protein ABE28_013120 [Peribacillus muralis]|uniref:Uncharacterized protein n=1 Tax=Peribacillus muralis TaxID=264697 RepID=A0A1B3XQ03_9BACI|nr:hypothetical protein ABE28_013120 [Peribacillus muralis]